MNPVFSLTTRLRIPDVTVKDKDTAIRAEIGMILTYQSCSYRVYRHDAKRPKHYKLDSFTYPAM
jgi:hypothetical protein